MPSRNLFFISSALAAVPAIYLGCANLAPVAMSGFGAPVQLPLAVVVLISIFGCGQHRLVLAHPKSHDR